MRNISNIKGVLYAVVSSATFGLIPLFSIPLLHAGMASPTILFYRMLLSAAIMAAVALLLKRNFRISRRDFGVLAGLSLMYAATSLGLLRSYDYIPSGVATTVNFLYPLVVTIVMTLFFRERSSVWIVIAVFISLVGVALLAWGDAGNNDPGRGLIYAGTTVFTYAVYIIGVMKSRAGRLDPLIVAFYVLTFSAAVFLVYALSTSGIAVVHTWHIWRNLLLLALLPTVLSNLTLVLAIKHIGSTMTSILGSMEPLTAVLVGVVHFGEGFDLDSAAGLILVVTAVIIVILQTNHTPQTPPANIPVGPKRSPYEAYEVALLRYIVRYGERILFQYTDEETNEDVVIRVSEYIRSELERDDLTFYTPLFKSMMDEAADRCRSEGFIANRYFLAHPDPNVSRLAANLISEKYQLSKYHTKYRELEQEEDKLDQLVIRELYAFKDAYVLSQIKEIQAQIKNTQNNEDMEQVFELMKKLTRLNEIKNILSKELGERIILKM